MAAYGNNSTQVNYADMVQAQVVAAWENSFLRFLNPIDEIAEADEKGAISVPIMTVVTMQDPVDGTLLNNSGAATFQALTFDDKVHPIKVGKSQQGVATANRLAAEAVAAGNAAVATIEAAVLVQYMAATSSDVGTFAATTGANFKATTPSAAERVAALKFLDDAISHVLGITGMNMSDIACVLPVSGTGGTFGGSWGNVYHNLQVEGTYRDSTNNRWMYNGIEVFGSNATATGWGLADGGTAGMVIHKNSGALAYGGVEDTGWYNVGDGFKERDYLVSYASAVVQNTWAEIMNKAT